MKDLKLVTLLMLCVFVLEGSTRKVCILREQKIVSTTTVVVVNEETTQNVENTSVVNEILTETGDDKVTEKVDLVTESVGDATETVGDATEVADDVSFAKNEDEPNLVSTENSIQIEFQPAASNNEERSTDGCVLEGITLFGDQNELLRRLCAITESSLLHIITIQNMTVESDLQLSTLCADGAKGLLSWIPWQEFIEKVKPRLNVEELPQLVIRNSSIGVPSESVNSFSEVLIEMLPLSYRLLNVKLSAWSNNTFIKEIPLGSRELVNPSNIDAHIEGSISYNFPVQTNTTFLSTYPINGLPVEMVDEQKSFVVGLPNKYFFESTYYVEKLVPAFQVKMLSLTGAWELREYDIQGTIVSIFGSNTDGTVIEESHAISARVVTLGAFNIKDSYQVGQYTTTSSGSFEELSIGIPAIQDRPVYPGFRNVFYVASVIFFGFVAIVCIDIARTLRRESQERSAGRRSYRQLATKS